MKAGDTITKHGLTIEVYQQWQTGKLRINIYRVNGIYSEQPILYPDGTVRYDKPDNWTPKQKEFVKQTLLALRQKEIDTQKRTESEWK
jgi:hypothetical protein